jgi:hypothetical protein
MLCHGFSITESYFPLYDEIRETTNDKCLPVTISYISDTVHNQVPIFCHNLYNFTWQWEWCPLENNAFSDVSFFINFSIDF